MKNLHFIGTMPLWLIGIVAAVTIALLVYQFVTLRARLSTLQSAILTLLRASAYGILIFFLLGPAWVEQRVSKLRRPLVVLVDSSQSMSFPVSPNGSPPGQPQKSRLEAVKEALFGGNEPLIQALSRDYDLKLFRFGTSLEPIAPSSLQQLAAQDQGTRLVELIEAAGQQSGEQAGIIVFSDGIANGDKKNLDGTSSLRVPVFTVGVGDRDQYTDLRVVEVRNPEFGFRGREIKIDVVVQAHGLKDKTVPLYFNRGQNLISSQLVRIDSDAFEHKFTFSFTPREIGTHNFTVSLPVQPGEQITNNNQKQFKVEVQRDKIRVLTLSGSPAWNYRFLRMAIKQDPLIDLVSFVFLRTPTDTVDVPDNELSLIPFPIDDIFLEELKNFDIVVLDDFSYRSYFNPVYLEKLREFVRDGGGLAMLGGPRSFDSGGYGESALKEVLPVELDGKGTYEDQRSVRAVLTASGKAHPVTRLLADARSNEEAWSKLPPLTGLNRVYRSRGETLLSATAETGGGVPLLTVGRFGKGRTLALMSDDAWRWNFIAVGNRQTPQHHLKFVRQALRWLAQEPSLDQVQIKPVARSRPGEKTAIDIMVLKDDFAPAQHASVQLRVIGPEGDVNLIPVAAAAEDGEYRGEYTPTREGLYRLEAEASLGGKLLGTARAGFSVALPFTELEDGRPQTELLKRLAETTHGEYFSLSKWNAESLRIIQAKLEEHAPTQIVEQRQTRLWSTLPTFSLALLLLSTEWWMRRKWGLV